MKRDVIAFALLAAACNDDPYPNKSEVNSVRILAVRADLPYAHPGETVKLEALVVDGRLSPAVPMGMWWFTVSCVDPPGLRQARLATPCTTASSTTRQPGKRPSRFATLL